ncbi:aminopeptidase N-like [Ptychodera flava]|uniref:aminopeptidase N-like n=1 Tax=Ptychodera flava TaxID=63121 RepID=UPI003969DB65
MAASPHVEYGSKSSKSGCFVTRTAWIIIVILVCALITLGVLLAYYVPDRSCDSTELPGEEEEEVKMPTPVEVPDDKEDFEGRTPDTFMPYHYDVWLQPYIDKDLDGNKFLDLDGKTSMYVECVKETNEIKVHHRFMTINKFAVYEIAGSTETELQVAGNETISKYDWFVIHMVNNFEVGKNYRVYFEHVGTVNQTDNRGFYYATYTEEGEEKAFVATQFQADRARRAFPCFDEPALKATFATTLVFRPHRIALSNMESVENSTYDDPHTGDVWNVTSYNTTVHMSTYLNAYTIGDWECIEDTTPNGIEFRVWSQPSLLYSGSYGLQIGMDQLTGFEELWEIKYPLQKMDMVALPVFGPGAMENWGLILYREVYLLYDSAIHTPHRKKFVSQIIAHELIHQWFGNLVTCIWWGELWLNEGFATYFEFYGLDMTEPGFYAWDQFFLKESTYSTFNRDQRGDSHPLIRDPGFAAEISSMFDTISYDKGGAVIMLMEGFLGQDLMFEGFRRYLNAYNYSHVESDNLWAALQETWEDHHGQTMKSYFGYDMKEIMDTWSLQMGFPVVHMTRTMTNRVSATQEHYLLDPNDEPQDTHFPQLGYQWHIPVTYTHEGQIDMSSPDTIWLHKGPAEIPLSGATNLHWYIANINQTTLMRINYDKDNWRKLAKQLQIDHTAIPVRSRSNLVHDALNLGQSHHQDHVIGLEIIQYLFNEDEHMPWQAFVNAQSYTKHMLWRNSTYGMLEKYIRHLVSPNYDSLGWDFDYSEDVDYYRRLDTLRTACDYNHYDCVANATSQYAEWMNDPENLKIEGDMRSNVYCTAIRHGSDAEWRFAYERQKVDSEERTRLRSALACSRAPWTLQSYMEEALEGDEFSASTTIGYVRDNSGLGFDLAWDFTLTHFDNLHEEYGDAAYDTVYSFTSKMNNARDLQQLNDFGAKYYDMPGTAANAFYSSVETVETNIEWVVRNRDDIRVFLEAVVQNIS